MSPLPVKPEISDRVASQLRSYARGRKLTAAQICDGMGDRAITPQTVFSALLGLEREQPPRAVRERASGTRRDDLWSRP